MLRMILSLTLLPLYTSCIKEAAKVSSAKTSTSGGSGGGSTGSPSTGADPLAAESWHLENTGQRAFSSTAAVSGEDISVKYVHETLGFFGKGVRIAVSDSGADIEHPDLKANTLSGEHRNYTSSSALNWQNADPYPTDDSSHGTSVAGLICALGWNGIGSRGVAPSSKFAAFRYIYALSSSETVSSFLAKTLDQASGNFDIFNYSYGYTGDEFVAGDPILEDAFELGVTTLRSGKGALYVQSSGNSFTEAYNVCDPGIDPDCLFEVSGNTNAHADQATPYKILVGATNAAGKKASYSTPGSSIWISAPGGEDGTTLPAMITTDIQSCGAGSSFSSRIFESLFDFGFHPSNPQCDYTNRFNGTSSAAPLVSGVIALMLEANPSLSWRDVKHILAVTADKIDYISEDPPLNILPHPNDLNPFGMAYTYDEVWFRNAAGHLFSNWYGFGRVNAERAVLAAMSYSSNLGTFEQTKNAEGSWYYDSGTITGKTIIDESPLFIEDQIWVGHDFSIEAVQIKLTTDHPWPGDLAIHLISPSGTESRLLTLNNNIFGLGLDSDFQMLSNAFYGESSEGMWKLRIYDGDSLFGTGDLLNWKILISGHRRSSDLFRPYPPTFMTLGSIPSTLDRSPVFNFSDSISHSSLFRYEAAIGDSSDNENIRGWTSIGLTNSGHQITGVTLSSATTYYLKIRAVSSGGVSSVQLLPWTTP